MNKYDNVMIQTAILWSNESYCTRKKVGAVLAKDGRILATGYNGTISGQSNCCEDSHYECPHCGNKAETLLGLVEFSSLSNIDNIFMLHCRDCSALIEKKTNNELNAHHPQHIDNVGFEIKPTLKTSDFTLHAEQNIISFCAKNGIPTKGTTIYITASPCKQCAKLIAQSGIERVVYKEVYRDADGIDFLKKVGVKIEKVKE